MITDAVWSEYEALVDVMLPTLADLKNPDGSPKWSAAMTAALLNRSGDGRISSHAISRVVALATSPQAQAQLAALGSAIAALEVLEHGPESASFYAAVAAQWSSDAEPLRAIVDISAAVTEAASASRAESQAEMAAIADIEAGQDAVAVEPVVVAAAPSVVAPTSLTDFVGLCAIPRPSHVLDVAASLQTQLPGAPWEVRLVPAVTESGKVGGFRFEIGAGLDVVLASERDGQKGARVILHKDGQDVTLRDLHEAAPEAAVGTLHPVIAAIEILPELVAEVVRVGRAAEELRKRLGDGDILVDAYFASASEAIAAEEVRTNAETRSEPITRAGMDPTVVPAFARTLQRMIEIAIDGHLVPVAVAAPVEVDVEKVDVEVVATVSADAEKVVEKTPWTASSF